MIEKKVLADFRIRLNLYFAALADIAQKNESTKSDGTSYVRPFVIFRDCIQKVVQFTEPAVINYGLCVLKEVV